MDLIYADKTKKDIGILHDYMFDLKLHCCEDDYLVYMVDTQDGVEEPTEYGGIIDKISVDTESNSQRWNAYIYLGGGSVMITLTNVIDVRTGKFHSIVRIKERNSKWFVPAETEEEG